MAGGKIYEVVIVADANDITAKGYIRGFEFKPQRVGFKDRPTQGEKLSGVVAQDAKKPYQAAQR